MQHRFFAFGSFSVGHVHYPKIANLISSQRVAFTKGFVYRLRCGYPVLVPDPEGDLIEGLLCELNAPESYWSILDEMLQVDGMQPQKSFFNRMEVEVRTDNFTQTHAQTYVLNPKKRVPAHKKITQGAWRQEMLAHPPINESLQVRQRQYIHKLSRSKGRDIVPIKLDLYRELMNLELIVDKGRRLALTPLGREASFFMER